MLNYLDTDPETRIPVLHPKQEIEVMFPEHGSLSQESLLWSRH